MIVVTGATGNVGRSLVQAMAEAGERVTAVSRGIAPVDLPRGTRHVRADLAAPETLRPALDGAEALFLHDGGAGGHGLDPRAILDVARVVGVRRVVLLSSQRRGDQAAVALARRRHAGDRGSGARVGPGLDDPAARRLRVQRLRLGGVGTRRADRRRAVR